MADNNLEQVVTINVVDAGAAYNTTTSCYDALKHVVEMVNNYALAGKSVHLVFPPGNYYIAEHKTATNGVTDLIFNGCNGLTVSGYGAVIRCSGAFNRAATTDCTVIPFVFNNCQNLVVEGIELNGSVYEMTHSAGITSGTCYGIETVNCSNVLLVDVKAHHFAVDNFAIGMGGIGLTDRRIELDTCTAYGSGRYGLNINNVNGLVLSQPSLHDAGNTNQAASGVGSYTPDAGATNLYVAAGNNFTFSSTQNIPASLTDGVVQAGQGLVQGAIADVRAYGAVLNGTTDDAAAINACLAASTVTTAFIPGGATALVNSPIYVPQGKALVSAAGNPATILVNHGHTDGAINLTGSSMGSKLEHLRLYPTPTLVDYYGVKLVGPTYFNSLKDVSIYYANIGLWMHGECNVTTVSELLVNYFTHYGIKMEFDGVSVPADNLIQGLVNGQTATPAFDTWGIYCDGAVNRFHVDVSYCKYPYQFNQPNTFWDGYIEHCGAGPVITSGIQFIEGHSYHLPFTLSSKVKAVGPGGLDQSYYISLLQKRATLADAKGIWLFDEVGSNWALDRSGNGKHIRYGTSTTFVNGIWGKVAGINYQTKKGPRQFPGGSLASPNSVCDWSQPFTIAALVRVDNYNNTMVHFAFSSYPQNEYTYITGGDEFYTTLDYDGSTLQQTAIGAAAPIVLGNGNWRWMVFGYDNANKKLYSLDPHSGYSETVLARAFTPINTGHLAEVEIGRDLYEAKGLTDASFAFLGVWQRILSMSEVYDLVNLKLPPRPPPPDYRLASETIPVNGVDGSIQLNYAGDSRRGLMSISINSDQWSAAAHTQSMVIGTLPKKARVVGAVLDTTTAFAQTGLATATLSLGIGSGAGVADYILAHDVKTAAVTKGLLDADLGTKLAKATNVQGGNIPSWTATSDLTLTLTTTGTTNIGDGTNTLLGAGSVTVYVSVEFL